MKVVIDYDTCVGCGSCVEICPAVFELGADDKAHVISDDYSSCDIEAAIDICPVEAIKKEA